MPILARRVFFLYLSYFWLFYLYEVHSKKVNFKVSFSFPAKIEAEKIRERTDPAAVKRRLGLKFL